MEHGFYHPVRGYWQTISEPDAVTLAGYPPGTNQVPLKPSADHEWTGAAWLYVKPTPEEILEQERAVMICSRFQAKAALMLAGHLDAVEAIISNSDALTQLAWREVTEFRRDSPMLAALAAQLDPPLSDTDIDELFRAAMQVTA